VAGQSAFVTGAFGLLGSALVGALLDRGDRVTVLRRDRTARSALSMLGLEGRVNVVDGDVCDQPVLERALGEYDVEAVFHLAAQAIVPTANASPAGTFDTNVRGTWTLMEAVRRHGPVRTVVASSDKAYGPHATLPYREDFALEARFPYDVSKAATDMIARSYWHTYGVPVAVTRFANLYGPGDLHPSRLIPEVILAALSGRRPVIRSDGSPERDFLFSRDAAAAYLAISDALDRPEVGGQAFNAGSGRPTSILEVVQTVCRLVGSDVEPDVRGAGTPAGEIDRQYVDAGKIRELCGWVPEHDLESGLEITIDWYRDALPELAPHTSSA
jgi:CDP-glucose 4,6-dehydratase